MKKDYTIAVAGTGYVGLSIATLLSQHHKVMAVDIVKEKVDLINNRKSPIQDNYIEKYLAEKELNLTATLDNNNDENSLSSVLAIAYLSAMQYYFKPIQELPTGRGEEALQTSYFFLSQSIGTIILHLSLN